MGLTSNVVSQITASSALPLSHPPSIITNHIRVQDGSRQSIKVSKCLAESSCPLTTLLELSRKTERKINCHVSWLSYSVSLSLFIFVPHCHLFSLQICTFKSFFWNLFLAPSSVYVACTPNKEFLKKCKVYYQTDRGKEKLIAEILWGDRSRQRTARTLIRLWDDPLFTDVATTTTKTTKNTPHWNCHLDFMRTLHPMKLLRPI